jgi:peptidoglycan/LPS O-acetylase OafA/YrhL
MDIVLISYFLIGTILFLWRDKIKYSLSLSGFFFPLVIVSIHYNCLPIAAPLLVYCLFSLGIYLPFRDWSQKIGDLSYGVYLYHWPIQILLRETGIYQRNYWLYIAICYAITFAMAFMSWNFVEKRFLGR